MSRSVKVRKYLGLHGCDMCSSRVRVYDWLPSVVLCAKCSKEIERQERCSQSKEKDR
jgi:hypothetical protein